MIAACTGQMQSLRIFVVENDADTLQCLTQYLQATGHTVATATTMTQALETLPSLLGDVLLSDLRLPDGDGWELLRIIRLSQPIYAIALSGLGTKVDRARSQEAGFHRHLLKPFPLPDLNAALEEAAREISRLESSKLQSSTQVPLVNRPLTGSPYAA